MPTRSRPLLILLLLLLPLSLEAGCSPAPTNDALGWNGRGTSLPPVTGAAGTSGQRDAGTGGGAGAQAGAGGTDATGGTGPGHGTGDAGAGGAGPSGGTGGGGAAGASGAAGAGGSPGGGGAGGTGGASGAPGDAGLPPQGGPPLAATCHLDVVVTTHSGGGNHQPKNVDAIWIQDAGGRFVKSLYVMARNEIQHLNTWNAVTTAAGLSRNRVDAVTGATLPGYGTRMASWNCTDVNQKLVAEGGYQVCFDLNDGNGADKNTCDAIMLGKTAVKVMPPDALPCFTGRALTYTP